MIIEIGTSLFIVGTNAFCRQMERIANNIATVNTDGYKAKKVKLQETVFVRNQWG